MRIVKQLTNNKYLNIKEVTDPENNVRGYQFAERRGKDSIAFICFNKKAIPEDDNYGRFYVNKEYTPPTNEFHFRAFGGSLDKSVETIEIVKDEVKEEVGFDVAEKDIYFLGSVFVSTQMNQYCQLYIVNIGGSKDSGRKPENAIEAMATPTWLNEDQIVDGDDWKAIAIIFKARARGII